MLLQHQKTGNVCCVCLVYLHFSHIVLTLQTGDLSSEQMMNVEASTKRVCYAFLPNVDFKKLREMEWQVLCFSEFINLKKKLLSNVLEMEFCQFVIEF